ncbi:MAG: DEAD/DEAH box helicase, partial [Burkholderiales bacterium]|nr:DEAD/DEAH box helicase [Burkholderiales bacterium]
MAQAQGRGLATLRQVSEERQPAQHLAEPREEQAHLPPALRPHLARLGIHHLRDCLTHFPLRYVDQTVERPISELLPGESVAVRGRVVAAEWRFKPRRLFEVQLAASVPDAPHALPLGPTLRLVFFHTWPGLTAAYAQGREVRVFGEVRAGRYGLEMIHPRLAPLERASNGVRGSGETPRLTPIYPTVASVPQQTLRTLITRAQRVAAWLRDPLPEHIRARLGLPSWAETVALLHAPPADVDRLALEKRTHPAWQRVKFEELLAQQIALAGIRRERERERALPLRAPDRIAEALMATLPFALTRAQQRALAEIRADLERDRPMMRLLQGDVGSGKTIVAALAALRAVEAGHQVAFMAPTELLAEQHFRKLAHWLEGAVGALGVRLAWLSGSLSTREKRRVRAACASGEASIVVGTHALFQKDVRFARLALMVVD